MLLYNYYTIKKIIEFDKKPLSEELLDNLLKEIANTLFSETQTYSEKNDSIQLLLYLKGHDLSLSYDWDNYYSNLKKNIAKAEKGKFIFFEQESTLILQLSLIILRITFGEDCLQETLEILALINNVRIPVKSSTESGHAVQWRREATLVREL